jgi:hypothetical protein
MPRLGIYRIERQAGLPKRAAGFARISRPITSWSSVCAPSSDAWFLTLKRSISKHGMGQYALCGPILAHEVSSLLDAVAAVPGVRNIENDFEPHDRPGNVPSLQGEPSTTTMPQQ